MTTDPPLKTPRRGWQQGAERTHVPTPGGWSTRLRRPATVPFLVLANAKPTFELSERDIWMARRHSTESRALLATFPEQAVVDIEGLGSVRFCHGSPRSDEECVTPETPEARVRALIAGVPERILVTAHTHLQFDRLVADVRSINPGSVGLPYATRRGAYWALLGPDVELRRTEYDLEETARRYRSSGDPLAEEMVATMCSPPPPEEVIEHAERVVFAG